MTMHPEPRDGADHNSRRVVIPNSELYTNRVAVNTAYEARRIHLMITICASDDVDKASAIVISETGKIDRVLSEPKPAALLQSLGDFGINLEVRYWVKPTIMREVVESTDEVYRAIVPALTAAAINMPFPTYQILFHGQTEETDGDRGKKREGWPLPKGVRRRDSKGASGRCQPGSAAYSVPANTAR
jgi:small conductance mechanosensitive channel